METSKNQDTRTKEKPQTAERFRDDRKTWEKILSLYATKERPEAKEAFREETFSYGFSYRDFTSPLFFILPEEENGLMERYIETILHFEEIRTMIQKAMEKKAILDNEDTFHALLSLIASKLTYPLSEEKVTSLVDASLPSLLSFSLPEGSRFYLPSLGEDIDTPLVYQEDESRDFLPRRNASSLPQGNYLSLGYQKSAVSQAFSASLPEGTHEIGFVLHHPLVYGLIDQKVYRLGDRLPSHPLHLYAVPLDENGNPLPLEDLLELARKAKEEEIKEETGSTFKTIGLLTLSLFLLLSAVMLVFLPDASLQYALFPLPFLLLALFVILLLEKPHRATSKEK